MERIFKVSYSIGQYAGHKYFTDRRSAWDFEEQATTAASLLGYRHIFKIHLEMEDENGQFGEISKPYAIETES